MIQHTAREQVRALLHALRYVRPIWQIYLLIFLLRSIRGIIHSVPFMLIFKAGNFLPFLREVVEPHIPEEYVEPASLAILILGGMFGAWMLHDVIILSFMTYLTWFTGMRVSLRMRLDFYRHLQSLPLSFFQKRPVGELMYRASSDIDGSVPLLLHSLMGFLSSIVTLSFFAVGLVSTGMPFVAYLFFMSLLPLFVFVHWIYSIYRKKDAQWRMRSQQLNATLRESIAAARVVKAFNKARFEALKYFHRVGDFYRANQRRFFIHVIIMLIQKSPIHGGYPLLYLLFGFLVLKGGLEAMQYLGVLYMCRSVLFFSDLIYQSFQQIRAGLVPVQRILETIDIEPEVAEDPDAVSLQDLRGAVEFRNVSFSYVQGTPVLKDVSFVLEPGQKLGLVGPSGAGKSTLAALLFRFWDPDSGSVWIDGHDVRKLKMNTVLKKMGVILHHTLRRYLK